MIKDKEKPKASLEPKAVIKIVGLTILGVWWYFWGEEWIFGDWVKAHTPPKKL